jgi:hypothetical protein
MSLTHSPDGDHFPRCGSQPSQIHVKMGQISTGSHPNGSRSEPDGAKPVGLQPREKAGNSTGIRPFKRALRDGRV